jgi:hypothetical protein
MTAPLRVDHSSAVALVDPVVVFVARCEARAMLYAAGEYTLHEAVDVLQTDAESSGLVELIGIDEVQRHLSRAFEAVGR